MNVIFFGSTNDSLLVLQKIFAFHSSQCPIRIAACVTRPSQPVGRKQVFTPTPVEIRAKEHNFTVLTFPTNKEKPWMYENEQTVIDTLSACKPDILISACYGQLIPIASLHPRYGGLNVHPSILPFWRGADPVPWTILSGDHQTGVTVVTIGEKFDQGAIIGQKKIPVPQDALPDPIRTTLFSIGAQLLVDVLPDYCNGKLKGKPQQYTSGTKKQFSYARRFTRDDGFIPWELLQIAMKGESISTIQQWNSIPIVKALNRSNDTNNRQCTLATGIERAFRALSPWPGLWTTMNLQVNTSANEQLKEKRLKILHVHVHEHTLGIDTVQLEGKKPVSFIQFQTAYL